MPVNYAVSTHTTHVAADSLHVIWGIVNSLYLCVSVIYISISFVIGEQVLMPSMQKKKPLLTSP